MHELNLTLPWPPSVNHYKKVGRLVKTQSGKIYQSRINTNETTSFYFQVYQETKIQMPLEWPKFALRDDILFEVRVSMHPPDKKRRDIDNPIKVLLDSLVHAKVIKDDSQITRLFIEKKDILKHGKIFLTISVIGDS